MKIMKHIVASASFAMIIAALSAVPALGQTQSGKEGAAAGAALPAKPVAAKRVRSKSDVDARHCLKLPTNIEIHRCAHKYL